MAMEKCEVAEEVLQVLASGEENSVCLLYGGWDGSNKCVILGSICLDPKQGVSGSTRFARETLPTGLEKVGVAVKAAKSCQDPASLKVIQDTLVVDEGDIVIIHGNADESVAFVYVNSDWKGIALNQKSYAAMTQRRYLVRLMGSLALACPCETESIMSAFQHLKSQVLSDASCFMFVRKRSIIRTKDNVIVKNSKVSVDSELKDYLEVEKDTEELDDIVGQQDEGHVQVLLQLSRDFEGEDRMRCCPVVYEHRDSGHGQPIQTSLMIDTLLLLPQGLEIESCVPLFRDSISSQLDAIETWLLRGVTEKWHNIGKYVPHHFQPLPLGGLPITIVYPADLSDVSLEKYRREIHHKLLLGNERPFLRRGCQMFLSNPAGLLFNPHEDLYTPSRFLSRLHGYLVPKLSIRCLLTALEPMAAETAAV
ncbi:unnamed protein product [Darwinula stevensoni]|uniref:UFSP2 second domain-containing protein n=1 Tax=Darwinula stevensoni TaxID=69355 RepID=A0A7R9FQC4_9CRUS|nr:unnamed protein product [Darwinula stevensoni]CAG0899487.1 unnamed protein product [Darwinula stevensoni]